MKIARVIFGLLFVLWISQFLTGCAPAPETAFDQSPRDAANYSYVPGTGIKVYEVTVNGVRCLLASNTSGNIDMECY